MKRYLKIYKENGIFQFEEVNDEEKLISNGPIELSDIIWKILDIFCKQIHVIKDNDP